MALKLVQKLKRYGSQQPFLVLTHCPNANCSKKDQTFSNYYANRIIAANTSKSIKVRNLQADEEQHAARQLRKTRSGKTKVTKARLHGGDRQKCQHARPRPTDRDSAESSISGQGAVR